MQEKDYLKVSELNQFIQQVIHAGFPEKVWVCGEIQGYNRSKTKKHIFFDLCEKDIETKSVLAKIGLVIFSNRKPFLHNIFLESGNPFELKDDIEVKFLCKVDFYPPHGAMRLIVESIDPAYTLGKIAAEKQRLIALLKKNGTLDKNKQLVLPDLPLRIGLITSYDSAAYNDFLSELRFSGFGFQVFYRNTLMQGKGAEADICTAFKELYSLSAGFDVIILTRGGGSIADLSCFDSQKIAETIACSPLPVLSGIGHEIDLTAADLAAYTYQKTPTAVAQFLIVKVENALTEIEERECLLLMLAGRQMKEQSEYLHQLALNFQQGIREFLKDHNREITRIEEIIQREPLRLINNVSQEVGRTEDVFLNTVKVFFRQKKQQMEHLRRFIEVSHPKNICKKGFSITRTKEGKLIRSVQDVKEKQLINTQLYDGAIESAIEHLDEGGPAWQN